MKILTASPPGSAEWQRARAGRITASIAADILLGATEGVFTYGTPLSAWARIKREREGGELDEPDPKKAELFRWGQLSEPVHRALLEGVTPYTISDSPGVVEHPSCPWLVATPDGIASGGDAPGPGVVELKAPTSWGQTKWSDGPPLAYQVQAAVQAMCCRLDWFLVSALIPPSPVWSTDALKPDVVQWILDGLGMFWEVHVARDIPPEPSSSDLELVTRMFRPEVGREIDLPADLAQVALELSAHKAAAEAAEEGQKACKARIIQALGGAERGVFPDGSGFTYKTQRRVSPPRLEETVSEFQVLRAFSAKAR